MSAEPSHTPPRSSPTMELPPDLQAVYANLVRIAHTPSELVFDYAHLLPGYPNARVCSRVIMSPLGAKLLHRALTENLSRYEATFGEIKIPGEVSLADSLFHPPSPDNPPKD